MNNVDRTSPAPSLFPKNSGRKTGVKAPHLQKTVLKRNSPARSDQLKNITQKDAKVTIPDAVKDFARIKKAVDAAPPIDNSDKIAMLKQQIKDGTYKVDYEALADKILDAEF